MQPGAEQYNSPYILSSFVDNTGAGVFGDEPETGWECNEVGVVGFDDDERGVSLVDAEEGDIGYDEYWAVVEGNKSSLVFFPLGDEAVSTAVGKVVEAAVVAEVAAKV